MRKINCELQITNYKLQITNYKLFSIKQYDVSGLSATIGRMAVGLHELNIN